MGWIDKSLQIDVIYKIYAKLLITSNDEIFEYIHQVFRIYKVVFIKTNVNLQNICLYRIINDFIGFYV